MSFLNLSAFQAILVALLTLGAVLALFFLKLRHRRVVVGSALLWHRVLHDQRANSLVEKLRRLFSLLIAITIALLIAMSVGRPYFSASGGAPQPVVIVMDSSESMRALTASGQTRWQVGVNEARRIVESSNSPAGVMAADTAGRVQTPVTDDRSEILNALGRMQPFAGDGRFPELPASNARIYFITDGVGTPSNVPDDAITVSVFEPADNVGITSFEIRVDPTSPSGYTAFLEVTNYSEAAKEVAIVVAGVGGQRVVRGANINSNASWNEALDLQGFEGGGIQARVQADGDRFATDDEAFAYLPARGELNVTLVTSETDGYLETLLELTPEVQLTVFAPESFEESVSTDVYVFDSFAPSTPPGRPSLLLGPPPASWLPTVRGLETDLQISTWDETHPVMRFVPVYDLGIGEAQVVDAGDRNVVAASDGIPLILVDDGNSGADGTRSVIVTFGLEDSDFAIHLGFPIFVENVLAWFSGETLAQTSRLGEIELPAGTSQINRLDGTAMESVIRSGRVVVELTEADLLTAVTDGRRSRVAANMTSPEGSAINSTSLDPGQTGPAPLPLAGNELWFYMLIGAMLLIAVEWWTYHRRITL
jgi:hypothetical protein